MPVVPAAVSDGYQAKTEWANAVRAWLLELGQVTTKGDLLVGASSKELARLALANPTETQGKAVLTGDFTTKDITWEKGESLSALATKKGQIIYAWGSPITMQVLAPPTTEGKHYLQSEVNASGAVTSLSWVTRNTLIANIIPQGTEKPDIVETGQIWIDTDA